MDTKESIYKYWNSRSETYTNGVIDEPGDERDAWKRTILESMSNRNGLKILDVGTGPGFFAMISAELGNEVTAVDLSENMLEKAKNNALLRGLSIDFMQGDAENLNLPDGQFDVVTNKCLLWTLPDPVKAITEWKRVLKDDGMVIAIDGDWHDKGIMYRIIRAASDIVRMLKGNAYPYIFRKHYAPIKKDLPLFSLKPEQVKRYFYDAGFTSVSIEEMDELCSSARKNGKILDKLDYSSPMYLIRAQK